MLFTGIQTVLNFIALGAVAVAYLYWRRDHSLVGLRRPTRRDAAIIVVGFVGFVAVMVALEALINLLGLELAENVAIAKGESNPEVFLLFIPLQFLFVAPAEELLFRAAALGVPIAGLGAPVWLMVPLAAAAFGLGHGAQGRVGIAVTGALGVALGALFVLTNSLLAVVVAHYVVNALELTVHEGLGIDRLVA